uniref:GST N-terminal domain-containing protein n=1 Tax=Macrostomum lignano TaxID=282301 RepID=A0A1I8FF04_9PLAT
MQSTLGDSKFFADGRPHDLAMFERLKPSCSLAGFQVPEERLKSLMSWMGRMEQQRRVRHPFPVVRGTFLCCSPGTLSPVVRTIKRWFSSGEGASLVVMETRHLEAGDPEPPELPRGSEVLTLYSMLYCPYAQRTRLVLQHKQLPHRIINVNLVRKPDWFLARAPLPSAKFLEEAFAAATSNGTDGDLMPSMGTPDAPRLRLLRDKRLAEMMHDLRFLQSANCLWDRLLWQLRNLQADLRDGGFFGGARPANWRTSWCLAMDRATAATDAAYCLPPRLPDSLGHLSPGLRPCPRRSRCERLRLPDWAHLAFLANHQPLRLFLTLFDVFIAALLLVRLRWSLAAADGGAASAEKQVQVDISVLSVIQLDFFRLFISQNEADGQLHLPSKVLVEPQVDEEVQVEAEQVDELADRVEPAVGLGSRSTGRRLPQGQPLYSSEKTSLNSRDRGHLAAQEHENHGYEQDGEVALRLQALPASPAEGRNAGHLIQHSMR